jgi:isocitrate dehydrogenase (NAD+)
MLRHLNEEEAANRIARAVEAVIADGRHVTRDLTATSPVGTKEMGEAIIAELRHSS